MQDSSVFRTFVCGKIFCCQLLPIESEFPSPQRRRNIPAALFSARFPRRGKMISVFSEILLGFAVVLGRKLCYNEKNSEICEDIPCSVNPLSFPRAT